MTRDCLVARPRFWNASRVSEGPHTTAALDFTRGVAPSCDSPVAAGAFRSDASPGAISRRWASIAHRLQEMTLKLDVPRRLSRR